MYKFYFVLILLFLQIPSITDGNTLIPIANPSERSYAYLVADALNNRCILFGGGCPWFKYHNDVWALDLTDETWHPLFPSGTKPPPRFMGSAVYYQPQNAMIIIGGRTDLTFYTDVWQLLLTPDAESWHMISTSGTPPSQRSSYSCIVDSLNSRIILFGGEHEYSWFNDVYALNLNTWAWSHLSPSGTLPSPRCANSAIYDPQGQRMIVFGGFDGTFYNDLWALSLVPGSESWNQLSPTGNIPAPRCRNFCSYSPGHNAMIIGFGFNDLSLYNDVSALDLNNLSWSCIVPSSPDIDGRRGSVSACLPAPESLFNARFIIFGGDFFDYYSAETYSLILNTLDIAIDHMRNLQPQQLLRVQQNPVSHSCLILLDLTPGSKITVQIFDNIGNLINTICDNETIIYNRTEMVWNCTDSQERRVPAGVYYIRARTSELEVSQKVVVLN